MSIIQYGAEKGVQLPNMKTSRPVTIATGAPSTGNRPKQALSLNDNDLVTLTNRKGRLFKKLGADAIANIPVEDLLAQSGPDYNAIESILGGKFDYRTANRVERIENVMDYFDHVNAGNIDGYGAYTAPVDQKDTFQVVLTPSLWMPPKDKKMSEEQVFERMKTGSTLIDYEGKALPESFYTEEMFALFQRVVAKIALDYMVVRATANQKAPRVVDTHTRMIPQGVQQTERMIHYKVGQANKR